jgi:hypothetical protein
VALGCTGGGEAAGGGGAGGAGEAAEASGAAPPSPPTAAVAAVAASAGCEGAGGEAASGGGCEPAAGSAGDGCGACEARNGARFQVVKACGGMCSRRRAGSCVGCAHCLAARGLVLVHVRAGRVTHWRRAAGRDAVLRLQELDGAEGSGTTAHGHTAHTRKGQHDSSTASTSLTDHIHTPSHPDGQPCSQLPAPPAAPLWQAVEEVQHQGRHQRLLPGLPHHLLRQRGTDGHACFQPHKTTDRMHESTYVRRQLQHFCNKELCTTHEFIL